MPHGPMGGPRPMSGAKHVIFFEVKDDDWNMSEFVIEDKLRNSFSRGVDVVVSESFEHEGQTITVITDKQEMDLFELNDLIKQVQNIVGRNFSDTEIRLKAK